MYKIIIVDDEFLARRLLQGYVKQVPDLELIGTAHNGTEAIELCKAADVDIALLDINMPDINGLEVARILESVPAKIFTTAYSDYALESYDVNAVDYLLKPIDLERFKVAIDKARFAVDAIRATQNDGEKDTMTIRSNGTLYRLHISDIIYIEGQHEYVTFHTRQQRITGLYALKNLEVELAAHGFMRIHKSYIINLAYVVTANTTQVTLTDHPHAFNSELNENRLTLPVGGSYRNILRSRLK